VVWGQQGCGRGQARPSSSFACLSLRSHLVSWWMEEEGRGMESSPLWMGSAHKGETRWTLGTSLTRPVLMGTVAHTPRTLWKPMSQTSKS
jgi:hypothetical protein